MNEVLITGVGLHTGFGDTDETWRAICEGASAVSSYQLPGIPGFPEVLGVPSAPFSPDEFLEDRKIKKYMSPPAERAIVAAGRALRSAGLLGDKVRSSDMALFISTGIIPFDVPSVSRTLNACRTDSGELDLKQMGDEGLRTCHPLMPFKMLHNMPLGLVSIVFGIEGENFISYPDAEQSGMGLETAFRGIQKGRFPRALVGGGVQGLSLAPLTMLLKQDRIALADGENQHGWVMADLSAFLVLESAEAAQKRGAVPLAKLAGVEVGRQSSEKAERLASFWLQCGQGQGPDAVVLTGSLGPTDDEFHEKAAKLAWPHDAPKNVPGIFSFDKHLGYAGAIAPIAAIGLAAIMVAKHQTPSWFGLPSCRDILVAACAPDEGSFAACVTAPEATK